MRPSEDPLHPIRTERDREVYDWMTSLGCVPKGGRIERCRHGHYCLVNAGHLLHLMLMDVCELGPEGEGDG
jgi:hypothetical protein